MLTTKYPAVILLFIFDAFRAYLIILI
jgi:hypothetical protein